MSVFSGRVGLAAVTVVLVLSSSGPALGAAPTEAQAFAAKLRTDIAPTFKKQAPKLVLGKVTCVLPTNGTVVHCVAHFAYPSGGLNIVYKIKATLLETGVIKWTTTSHSCTVAKTGKPQAC